MSRLLPLLGMLALVNACSSSPFRELTDQPQVCLIEVHENQEAKNKERTEVELLESYYGLETPIETIQKRSLSGDELLTILEDRGFTVFSFSGSLRQEATGVIDNLDAGRPLLLLLDAAPHGAFWVLVVGYDEDGEYLVVYRPDSTLKVLTLSQLMPWWQNSERLTLLAIPNHLMGE